MITHRFPELLEVARFLPDGVAIDGEMLSWKNGGVLPFADLQQRIGRKTIGKKLLEDVPAAIVAYDLLELDGKDIRERPLVWRRERLDKLLKSVKFQDRLIPSPIVTAKSWKDLEKQRLKSRELNVEGLMLKRRDSPYRVGRTRGDWWKWKIEPYTADAVLIYAQRGNGKRASLYTDYTFGVWDGETLVRLQKRTLG